MATNGDHKNGVGTAAHEQAVYRQQLLAKADSNKPSDGAIQAKLQQLRKVCAGQEDASLLWALQESNWDVTKAVDLLFGMF
jgi:hypothetical protein